MLIFILYKVISWWGAEYGYLDNGRTHFDVEDPTDIAFEFTLAVSSVRS